MLYCRGTRPPGAADRVGVRAERANRAPNGERNHMTISFTPVLCPTMPTTRCTSRRALVKRPYQFFALVPLIHDRHGSSLLSGIPCVPRFDVFRFINDHNQHT